MKIDYLLRVNVPDIKSVKKYRGQGLYIIKIFTAVVKFPLVQHFPASVNLLVASK